MTSFIVGRGGDDDVVSVGGEFKNVSRRHIEVRLEDGGRCRITDLGSANGTEVLERGRWQPVRKVVVSLDHRLRLGREYEASVRDFLGLAQKQHGGIPGRAQGVAQGVSLIACPSCGAPARGEVCAACGERLVLNPEGFAKIIADDMLGWQEKRGYLPALVGLLISPVRTSLRLARDPSFKLHGVFIAMSLGLYIYLVSRFQKTELDYRYFPSLPWGLSNFVSDATLIGVSFYITFFIRFVINFYVFKDYSSSKVVPRAYLKLSCLAMFIFVVALIVWFIPMIAAVDRGPEQPELPFWIAAPIFLILMVVFIVFMTQYAIRTAMGFWNISAVSAFRGIVVSWILAIIVVGLGVACIALVFTAFAELFQGLCDTILSCRVPSEPR